MNDLMQTKKRWDEKVPGHSNSSVEFDYIASRISAMIRTSAHDIVCGNTLRLGILITAQLTHRYGFTTSKTITEMKAAE